MQNQPHVVEPQIYAAACLLRQRGHHRRFSGVVVVAVSVPFEILADEDSVFDSAQIVGDMDESSFLTRGTAMGYS
jgi:hypothetical protein